jgi:hypothetical protein
LLALAFLAVPLRLATLLLHRHRKPASIAAGREHVEGNMRLLPIAVALMLAAGSALAQGGKPWFAYIGPVPAFDYNRQPVIDPATGKPKEDGFCLVWREGWVFNNKGLDIVGGSNYYDGMSYRVNPSGTITLYQVYRRDRRAKNGRYFFMTDYTAKLYPKPQPGWPCAEQTWAQILSTPDRQYGSSGARPLLPTPGPVHHTPIPRPPCVSHYLHAGC